MNNPMYNINLAEHATMEDRRLGVKKTDRPEKNNSRKVLTLSYDVSGCLQWACSAGPYLVGLMGLPCTTGAGPCMGLSCALLPVHGSPIRLAWALSAGPRVTNGTPRGLADGRWLHRGVSTSLACITSGFMRLRYWCMDLQRRSMGGS